MDEKHNPPSTIKKKKEGRKKISKPENWELLCTIIVWNTQHNRGLSVSGLGPVLMEENVFLKIKATRKFLDIC